MNEKWPAGSNLTPYCTGAVASVGQVGQRAVPLTITFTLMSL